MTLRGTTALLAILVAVSSAGWAVHTSVQAMEVPAQWVVPTMMGLLPHAAAAVAAVLVLRATPWWRRAALGYLAAFMSLEAVGLVQIVPFASQLRTGVLWWSMATSALALLAVALTVIALRGMRVGGDDAVPGSLRWAAVVAGLLIVGSSTVAWVVSPQAPNGRLTSGLGQASTGVLIGTILGMVVVAAITAVVATSAKRSLVVGAGAGLLASRQLAVSVFADPTWQDAAMVLAAGWWLALAAQVLLVVSLVGLLAGGADRDGHVAPEPAPTGT